MKYSFKRNPDVLLGLREIADYMGCCPQTIRRWRRTLEFPAAILPGNRCMTTRPLIDAWIRGLAAAQQGPAFQALAELKKSRRREGPRTADDQTASAG